MWGFKIKPILVFISMFLVLYAILFLLSALILFNYSDLTIGEKIYGKIAGLLFYFPLNPLWNNGKWPIVIFILNGSFWGFICYSIIFGVKKLKVRLDHHN